MVALLWTVCKVLLLINAVILTHELGHYWAAIRCGIACEILALGFGPTLWRKKLASGTHFHLNLLPLGGYVKLNEEAMAQSTYKRLWVLIAGPLSNFICATFTLMMLFVIGFHENRPIIGAIIANTPAQSAQMKPMRLITAVDDISIDRWQDVLYHSLKHLSHRQPLKISTETLSGQNQITHVLKLNHWQLNPKELDIFISLGFKPFKPHTPPILARVIATEPAAMAGLIAGDKILKMNQQPILTWSDITDFLKDHSNQTIDVQLSREGHTLVKSVQLGSRLSQSWHRIGFLGVAPPRAHWPKFSLAKHQATWLHSIKNAMQDMKLKINLVGLSIKLLLNGNLPLTALASPIGIANIAYQAINSGWVVACQIFATLSVMVGILNLLPLPGLDGGQILFTLIESVTKKPISIRWQQLLTQLTMIIIIVLVMQLTIRDIGYMLSGG